MEIKKEVQRGTMYLSTTGDNCTTVSIQGEEIQENYSCIMVNNQELAILAGQFVMLCKLKGIPIDEILKML